MSIVKHIAKQNIKRTTKYTLAKNTIKETPSKNIIPKQTKQHDQTAPSEAHPTHDALQKNTKET